MRVPGFTAAKSLYTSDQSYRLLAGASARAAEVQPQFCFHNGLYLTCCFCYFPGYCDCRRIFHVGVLQ